MPLVGGRTGERTPFISKENRMRNKTISLRPKAHKVFREIAHELSNGKVVKLIEVFDALAARKEEVRTLVKAFLKHK